MVILLFYAKFLTTQKIPLKDLLLILWCKIVQKYLKFMLQWVRAVLAAKVGPAQYMSGSFIAIADRYMSHGFTYDYR